MTTITFTIEEDVKARFEALAQRYGLDQAQLLREALVEKLEELEDYQAVTERMSRPYGTVSNERVWKELDLED